MQRVQKRVRKGTELLDRYYPDWYWNVDPDSIAIMSCTKCVLGQLYGHYQVGLIRLNLMHGMNHGFGGFMAKRYKRAWREEILHRRVVAVTETEHEFALAGPEA